jgi:hypothetical protein
MSFCALRRPAWAHSLAPYGECLPELRGHYWVCASAEDLHLLEPLGTGPDLTSFQDGDARCEGLCKVTGATVLDQEGLSTHKHHHIWGLPGPSAAPGQGWQMGIHPPFEEGDPVAWGGSHRNESQATVAQQVGFGA